MFLLDNYDKGDSLMPKKRRSGGRTRGKKGVGTTVTCASCGQLIEKSKAKKFTVYRSAVDYRLAREIQAEGGYIPRKKEVVYYCISCAIHRHKIQPGRKREDRKRR